MTVRKRGSVWHFDFMIRGIRYREAVPEAKNKTQAEQAEVAAKQKVFEGKYCKPVTTSSVADFINNEFLPWSKQNKRSWRNDKSRSKPILKFFKGKKLAQVSRQDIEQYKKARMNAKHSRGKLIAPASVNRELQLLSRIFSYAVERGMLVENPSKGVRLVKVKNHVIRYLTTEEERKLMEVLEAENPLLHHIIRIALYAGMRKQEILTLRKSHIDFVRESIELLETKSGKPRSIPILPSIKPLLVELCEGAGANGYLFENPKTGKPFTDIKKWWQSALRKAGITNLRFHDLRHTFGTRAADGAAL